MQLKKFRNLFNYQSNVTGNLGNPLPDTLLQMVNGKWLPLL